MNPRYKQIATIFIYGFTTLLLIDYVLANGGYYTVLTYYHPVMVALSSTLIVSMLIWNILRAIESAIKCQWKKSLIILLCLVIIFFGTKVTIKILAEKSEKKANNLVGLFFTADGTNFDVQIDDEVRQDYSFFLSHYDPAAIQLLFSFPPYGRYDYLVTPKYSRPFMLTLWVSDHGGRVLVSDQWYKHRKNND